MFLGKNFTPNNVQEEIFIVKEWDILGRQLGQSEQELEKIKNECGENVGKARDIMIDEWIKNDKDASWNKLLLALDKMDNYEDLINDISMTVDTGKLIIKLCYLCISYSYPPK